MGCEISEKEVIMDYMFISNGNNLLINVVILNQDIREFIQKPVNKNTWRNFKFHFQDSYIEWCTIEKTAQQRVYKTTINSIYGMTTVHNETSENEHQKQISEESLDNFATVL